MKKQLVATLMIVISLIVSSKTCRAQQVTKTGDQPSQATIQGLQDRLNQQSQLLADLGASQKQLAEEIGKLTPPGVAGDGSPDRQALIKKLENYLSGTKWTGNFLLDGKQEMIKERYEILSAKKSEFGDKWNLVARIKYADHDATLPLPPIDIMFAGRTPVISVDRLFFPGFGTFDARVVIRGGKYAGTWRHDTIGGHMFGTIEKMPADELEATRALLKKKKLDD